MRKNPEPFILHLPPEGRNSPVVFDSPHSGDQLPPGFRLHDDFNATDRDRQLLRDCYLDVLLKDAPDHGVALLLNPYDRIFIDLNSEEDEIDPDLVRGPWHGSFKLSHSVKALRLGLIASALLDDQKRLNPLFNALNRPTAANILDRVQRHYRPYYATLENRLEGAVQAYGFGLHVNFHSTPRVPFGYAGGMLADITLGDLNGRTCHPVLRQFAEQFFNRAGLSVQFNAPFPGGALVRQTGQPAKGRHSLQIEIVRDLYMNMETLQLDPIKAAQMQGMLADFSRGIVEFSEHYSERLKPDRKDPQPGQLPDLHL